MLENKQIIIDGVDVSGCVHCLKMTGYRCTIQRDVYKCLCRENPNCYYKQLKRTEAQCEGMFVSHTDLEMKYKVKEQSEEKLVKQLQTICDFINNRPETFKGVNGSVDKIITDYAKAKEQECEELKVENKKLEEELLDLKLQIEEEQLAYEI